jgi:tetratricopeptide (TPR) repeat protein
MWLSIALAGAAWSQENALLERIKRAPLPPDQQASLVAAYTHQNFASVEKILSQPNGELKALLGALEFVGGRTEPAVQAFHEADALRPLSDQDRFTLAMAEIKLLDGKGSRAELTRLNRDHPNSAIYLYWLARLDYDQRLYDAAVEKLKRVIVLDPASVRGYDNLGLAYDMMGLATEAQAAFARAVEMNRKLAAPSAWPPHNLGYLQLRLLQLPEAEDNLRESVRYDPKFALAHYHLARTLEKEEKDEAAIEEYKSAAALDATLAEPLYSLGLLYRRQGRTTEADSALAEYKKRRAQPVR